MKFIIKDAGNPFKAFHLLAICLVMLVMTGCQDLSDPSLPAGTQSPDTYMSRAGGFMLAVEADRQFRDAWVDFTVKSGVLTDELTSRRSTGAPDLIDHRDIQEGIQESNNLYGKLHKLRGQARIARSVLEVYAPDVSQDVRGRLYAFEAYSEVWLADMYCSGVPLSTVDLNGDFTNFPSSTTDEVYAHAITLFDSSLAIAADIPKVQTLARVGKGRALLALGRYEDAEAAVAEIQVGDAYQTMMVFSLSEGRINNAWGVATVSDREGENGLPFRSGADPRTATQSVTYTTGQFPGTSLLPYKYALKDSVLVTIAAITDAQLIQAEAALQRSDWGLWLSTLNTLRTDGTYTRIDTTYLDSTEDSIKAVDTVWKAGLGQVDRLGPLDDPGIWEEQVKLHFSERAAWLFVTGNRQGDLRRLVRKYGFSGHDVYPTGSYAGLTQTGVYGNNVDLPIPPAERQNPLFKGCLKRD